MLVDAWLAILKDLIDWVISMRPAWVPSLDPSIANFLQALVQWDWLFPVHETIQCVGVLVGLIIVFNNFKWILKLADWIADIIP